MVDGTKPLRIAFVKFGGLSAGGTERWLQMMAANLPREKFAVDYYYCDAAPYIGSDYRHADTDPHRLAYMQAHGVNLIRFTVGAKDIRRRTHDWVDTNFWKLFREEDYDLVQAGKAGPAEYPFHLLKRPVVELVALNVGADRSRNIAFSVHFSQWQRREWVRAGGNYQRSDVIPVPVEAPTSDHDLRGELGIPSHAVVAGFHQRADDNIFSPIPLEAFARLRDPDGWFILMGGGSLYRRQAQRLGLANVRFVEHSGDPNRISAFLNTLDIFAHGRRDGETFGTVLAEAMMHGKPCLSHRSEIGANAQRETMGPGGIFADGLDEYTRTFQQLFSNPTLRHRLGEKGRAHAQQYYSLDAAVERLGGIYEQVAGRAGSRAYSLPVSYTESPLGFLSAGADACWWTSRRAIRKLVRLMRGASRMVLRATTWVAGAIGAVNGFHRKRPS